MPDWDEDSRRLGENLAQLLEEFHQAAGRREMPSVAAAKGWQARIMAGLEAPDPRYAGTFRGESGLENLQVKVGKHYAVDAAHVSGELRRFEAKLHTLVDELDALLPAGGEPDADQMAAIVDLCAWAHAEWVRIHPFANGNGRTARLWANWLAIRYGLPPFVRLRPRPDAGYADDGNRAMQGDWKSTVAVFRQLLDGFLDEL